MKFVLSVLFIALLSGLAEYFLPWWSIAIVCFTVPIVNDLPAGKAFLSGAAGIGLLWLAVILMEDVPNEHILSARMAGLFKLPHYSFVIVVTVILGMIVGGLSSLCGSLIRHSGKKKPLYR